MRAIPNLGVPYVQGFEAIYPDLAAKYDLVFYPFFLDGIAGEARFNQRDGLHPTAEGHRRVAANVQAPLELLLAEIEAERR